MQVKSEYEKHALTDHPDKLPEDLQLDPVPSSGDIETMADISIVTVSLSNNCLATVGLASNLHRFSYSAITEVLVLNLNILFFF